MVYRIRVNSYEDYLRGKCWADRKLRYFKNHPRRCEICFGGGYIHLHHLTYKRLGSEFDRDLMPLCSTHHKEVHRFAKERGLPVYGATLAYLKDYRLTPSQRRRMEAQIDKALKEERSWEQRVPERPLAQPFTVHEPEMGRISRQIQNKKRQQSLKPTLRPTAPSEQERIARQREAFRKAREMGIDL